MGVGGAVEKDGRRSGALDDFHPSRPASGLDSKAEDLITQTRIDNDRGRRGEDRVSPLMLPGERRPNLLDRARAEMKIEGSIRIST